MEPVKVFLDTNILLDYYTGRMGDNAAKMIVLAGQTSQFELCISILTAINVLYLSSKYNCALQAADISRLFRILPMDYQQYRDAQSLNIPDFEDALQIVCARNSGCRAIVTRDKKLIEYGMEKPLCLSPEDFLLRIGC